MTVIAGTEIKCGPGELGNEVESAVGVEEPRQDKNITGTPNGLLIEDLDDRMTALDLGVGTTVPWEWCLRARYYRAWYCIQGHKDERSEGKVNRLWSGCSERIVTVSLSRVLLGIQCCHFSCLFFFPFPCSPLRPVTMHIITMQ